LNRHQQERHLNPDVLRFLSALVRLVLSTRSLLLHLLLSLSVPLYHEFVRHLLLHQLSEQLPSFFNALDISVSSRF
jgi:hypothetical protein